jgi:hypothetical protein
MELELASVGPFIQSLPAIDRHRILALLVPKYFGAPLAEKEYVEPLAMKALAAGTDIVKAVKQ